MVISAQDIFVINVKEKLMNNYINGHRETTKEIYKPKG